MDTIYALATPPGRSAIAIIRVSGANLQNVFDIFSINFSKIKHRYVNIVSLYFQDVKIENAVLLFFQAPFSFTGENLIEFQIHGSNALVNFMMNVLSSVADCRMAEPGEFTRRAILNNKMNLVQTEYMIDVINSDTEEQLLQSVKRFNDCFADIYLKFYDKLMTILSKVEALIDFPDDEISEDIITDISIDTKKILYEIRYYLGDNKYAEKVKSGFGVVIVGRANAGKSSLFNLLARREAAIVSDIAGTTRDALEVQLDIKGHSVVLSDTAGLRDHTADAIEAKGMKKASQLILSADVILFVFDNLDCVDDFLMENDLLKDDRIIRVLNKCDHGAVDFTDEYCQVSVKKNIGIDYLIEQIVSKIRDIKTLPNPLIANQRQRENLETALQYLVGVDYSDIPIELNAENLRIALKYIGKIIGKESDCEDVLDRVFSEFCIGK